MRNHNHQFAFSLNELLITLSVIAVLGVIVVPQYIELQDRAKDVAAAAMADELNRTYANWVAAGGRTGNRAATSDMLTVITSNQPTTIDPFTFPDRFTELVTTIDSNGNSVTEPDTGGIVADDKNSSSIRIGKPSGLVVSPSNPQNIVKYDDGYIVFNPSNGIFTISKTYEEALAIVAASVPPDVGQTISVSIGDGNGIWVVGAEPGNTFPIIAVGGHNSYIWSSDSEDLINNTGGTNAMISLTVSPLPGTHTISVFNEGGNGYKQSNVATISFNIADYLEGSGGGLTPPAENEIIFDPNGPGVPDPMLEWLMSQNTQYLWPSEFQVVLDPNYNSNSGSNSQISFANGFGGASSDVYPVCWVDYPYPNPDGQNHIKYQYDGALQRWMKTTYTYIPPTSNYPMGMYLANTEGMPVSARDLVLHGYISMPQVSSDYSPSGLLLQGTIASWMYP
jgi:type II secretory pathway pseudopilin PulG